MIRLYNDDDRKNFVKSSIELSRIHQSKVMMGVSQCRMIFLTGYKKVSLNWSMTDNFVFSQFYTSEPTEKRKNIIVRKNVLPRLVNSGSVFAKSKEDIDMMNHIIEKRDFSFE